MKSLTQFLEAQKFLIKGHTKKQSSAIDLDLPSGTKWAPCNIGADKPEDPGLLFQWGRIDGYEYGDENHNFLSGRYYRTTSGTEYKQGNVLKSEDDAAYQATKGIFRIPTAEEIDELLNYTDNKWTKLNGVEGMKFISKKDKYKWIFIPAAGFFFNASGIFNNSGIKGFIWGSSVRRKERLNSSAYYIRCQSDECAVGYYDRSDGMSVRGVLNT